jgi:hypothetical protein
MDPYTVNLKIGTANTLRFTKIMGNTIQQMKINDELDTLYGNQMLIKHSEKCTNFNNCYFKENFIFSFFLICILSYCIRRLTN